MIRAAIFDLDGVIVDTAKYHYLAWKRLANELGFDFTEQDNEQLKGVSRMASLEILLNIGNIKNLSQQEKEKLAQKKNDWYVDYIAQITPLEILPGFLDLFKFLKSNHIKVAVGSASKNARTILSKIGLINLFDTVVDGNRITKAKPDPQVFTKAADDMDIPYNLCVVFEDAEAGIEAAINAGMKCVGIGTPILLRKANIVVQSLDQLDFNEVINLC
jgi:beta-phosphoglucomutase